MVSVFFTNNLQLLVLMISALSFSMNLRTCNLPCSAHGNFEHPLHNQALF